MRLSPHVKTPDDRRDGAPIRILCVDDHRIVREGIELIIARQPDMEVVGSAASGQESLTLYREQRPDVTLMDLQLGAMSGVDAIRGIQAFDGAARIIVLTMYQGDEDIFRALEAGAVTYLLKDTLSEDLIDVVRQVHAGVRPKFSPDVQARLDERAGRQSLTPREIQVVELIGRGLRNKEIAASLGITEETAQVHVRNILSKLKVQDRTAAIRVALQRGIIHITQ
jgi:two-component system NarL family response regulator